MADIYPFRGVRYDTAHAQAPLTDLVAPPYDVISPDEQAALYDRNPANVIRLILGRESDRYESAARTFRQWQSDGILTTDSEPSVYVYRQTFHDPLTGQAAPERIGLVCLLKLEEYSSGVVLPHEKTLTGAKADRLDLLRTTNAQFESIYGLYSDPDRAVQSFLGEYADREPAMETVPDAIGSSHTVERLGDASTVTTLRDLLADKPIFIADGHHRYETALNYRKEQRAAHPEWDGLPIAADYILITLTAFEDEGLLVLPTHRLVRGVDNARLRDLSVTHAAFSMTPMPQAALETAMADATASGQVAFGLLLPDQAILLTLETGGADAATLLSGPQSDALKRLPVTLLQTLILDQCLGIDASALAAAQQVAYTRDADDAQARVESGEFQAAFLLPRPTVQDVRDVSLAGDTMPQKSTFFFPKLLSGLLLRDLAIDPDPMAALVEESSE